MAHSITTFNKLLVANRGEIAIRVLRAASELNIRTVAIYTYEDRYSLHRYKADESYQIGEEDDPLKPYLDIEEILRIAKKHQVDAIHPGYGFLSENVSFARRCREEGVVFIGPSPESMEQVGDKIKSKNLAQQLGVPLIEGSKEDLLNYDIARTEANRIGYPIMIKAASGGGGRGMRIVRNDENLKTEFEEARREAATAFGDDTVFLEKYIANPKHIEVQILGDQYGNMVHLFERDCSVQRRFQKVVEIAPSKGLKEETLLKLYQYAIDLCKGADYSCAGTVEFLVEGDDIYFIEINPRIQVEHTITEEITGIDIVRTQILVAMGFPLNHSQISLNNQSEVSKSGFAIQCRITTEDPSNDFKPNYGTLIAYRSANGFGIRLDAGSAYPGAKISPYFDSLLVKVSAKGRTLKGAADRLHRALREFRVRGVKTNIDYLLNLLKDETFVSGNATVNFIKEKPELLNLPFRRDRATRLMKYLAETVVNGNPDVKYKDERVVAQFRTPIVPNFDPSDSYPKGSKNLLDELGAEGLSKWMRNEKPVLYTDTTFRDAHQSLLATRMRSFDMLAVAEAYGKLLGDQLFSMEVWGGATFDVCLRFLRESPWGRLERIKKAIPNVLLQMLLRGSNGVGYKAYPDNLIERFIDETAECGIDLFRIFDSLNWVEAMKISIARVRKTGKIAEACICYTGDITDPTKTKFDLEYYIALAKQLEDEGAHIIAVKDMAGLLKPQAAEILIPALRDAVELPVHLHTHDTSSIQAATYLKAIEAGVDAIDVAAASMSGLTSQPNFNSVVAMMKGHERERKIDLEALNKLSVYWEAVRPFYHPFETELRSGTAEVYEHEIPGGQYSNLRPQARGLGLEEKFETIKKNYRSANELVGDIIKVTPSSKVVGDLAMFMTSNGLSKQDVLEKGKTLSFPDSVKDLMRGNLGQIKGGFPLAFQEMVLQNEKPFTDRPNAHLAPIDFKTELKAFYDRFGHHLIERNFISYLLYPKVYEEYQEFRHKYGPVRLLTTPAFFFGLQPNEEILVEIEQGKTIIMKFLNYTEPNEQGNRLVFFMINGQTRSTMVHDRNLDIEIIKNRKAEEQNEIGAPLQGKLSKILVKEGDQVTENHPLFVIEAMKMESTITSPIPGLVKKIHLSDKAMVEQDDLVVEISPE